MEYMYYDNLGYDNNKRWIQESLKRDYQTHIFREMNGYPTREELIAEAKEVFSKPIKNNRLYDVKRIRDNTGTTIEIQGKICQIERGQPTKNIIKRIDNLLHNIFCHIKP